MSFLDPELKFLIVDDHQMTRMLVQDLLTTLGASVENIEQAEDGKVAYGILSEQSNHFDVVYLDWHMPGMTGIELLKLCREDSKFNDTIFVMITAEGEKANVMDAVRSGANSYIQKPFTDKVFEDKLKAAVNLLKAK
jgi:two-component system, chemotaxis family, chemotaxis protein CheY